MKERYSYLTFASSGMMAAELEALKNGLIEDTSVNLSETESSLGFYRKEKLSLLEQELLHVGRGLCVGEVDFPLEKDVTFNGIYCPPCTLAFAIYNSFYPLLALQVHYLFSKKPFTVFLKADEMPYEDFKRTSFVFAIYSKANDKWGFKRINLAKLPPVYWEESKKHVQQQIRCSDVEEKIKNPKYSLGFWPEAKLYAESLLRPDMAAKNAFYFTRIEMEFWLVLGVWHKLHDSSLGQSIEQDLASFPKTTTKWDLSSPSSLYLQAVDQINKDADLFLADFIALSNKVQEQGLGGLLGWINFFLRLCIWSPSVTKNGTKIPTITLGNPFVLEYFDLSTDFSNENREEYFATMSFEMPWYFRETIGTGNIQVSKDVFKANFPAFQDEPSEAIQIIKDQLEEAVSLKQSVIPFGGYFCLSGAVAGVKLFEINQDVYCVFAFNNGRYIRFVVNPYDKTLSCPPDFNSVGFEAGGRLYGVTKVDDIEDPQLLGLLVLISAMIRDSWVIEVRETVFGGGVLKRKVSPLLGDRREQVMVYLARIKYITKANDVKNARNELDYAIRRQHWVRGHLRNALKASPAQVLLAQKAGVYIPEGKTWVREHRRGDQAAEKVYRSRSALRLLHALSNDSTGTDSWFGFERSVKEWLDSNGFKTIHVSASRNGDGGVDVQAVKGSECLYVQCKYWKNKVGPSVVREMMGTLLTAPENSSGVIVTSSELSVPARELAMQFNIQFIENVNFDQPIEKTLK